MAASDTIKDIKDVVEDLPLQDILETAELVACVLPIPYLPAVIKVLKIAVKLTPAASQSLDAAAKISKSIEDKQDGGAKRQFESLLDMACSDGEVTGAEKEFLITKANAAGISVDEMELMIINKINK